jgi:hypothetical protein
MGQGMPGQCGGVEYEYDHAYGRLACPFAVATIVSQYDANMGFATPCYTSRHFVRTESWHLVGWGGASRCRQEAHGGAGGRESARGCAGAKPVTPDGVTRWRALRAGPITKIRILSLFNKRGGCAATSLQIR